MNPHPLIAYTGILLCFLSGFGSGCNATTESEKENSYLTEETLKDASKLNVNTSTSGNAGTSNLPSEPFPYQYEEHPMLLPLFPDLLSIPRPDIQAIPMNIQDSRIVQFKFADYEVRFVSFDPDKDYESSELDLILTDKVIELDQSDSCTMLFIQVDSVRKRVTHSFLLQNSAFFLHDPTAFTFDADQNGKNDLFFEWSQNGGTGRGSSAPRIEAFFQDRKGSFRQEQFSSFYGDVNLFRDYDRDGNLDFACIRYEVAPAIPDTGLSNKYNCISVNLFSFRNGKLVNISKSKQGWPALVGLRNNGTWRALQNVPDSVRYNTQWLYLKRPNVWK